MSRGTRGSDQEFDVSVVGLGRVGLPLALCFADRGLSVLGVDNNPEITAALRDGRMPFDEPGWMVKCFRRRPSSSGRAGRRLLFMTQKSL